MAVRVASLLACSYTLGCSVECCYCCCVAVLEREREETKEAESSVAALRRQVAAQREAVAALDADIEQYRARVANLRKG